MNDMKIKFTAYVGLDWADKKHDVRVQIGEADERNYYVIKHSPEAIEQWIVDLHKQVKGKVMGIIHRAISTHIVNRAGFSNKQTKTGAVTLIKRFGSALNLNIHFHLLFLEGAISAYP